MGITKLERRKHICSKRDAIAILEEVYCESTTALGCKISEAYLYGSYARGDYHEESDVDILLVVDIGEEDLSRIKSKVAYIASRLSLKFDVTVSIVVKPIAQFVKYANTVPFYSNVIREGIRFSPSSAKW